MSLLPPVGLARYGDFTFNGSTETVGFEVRPVYDQAGRTVTHSVWLITLRTTISGTPTDAQVQAAVRTLSKPGERFYFTGRGLGDLRVNVDRVRDVAFGPRPQVVALVPKGAGNACELTWQVEVAIPTCADAKYQFAPMEFVFKLTYDIDRSGYTKRVYSGFVRVPMTRRAPNDRGLPDSVDAYRERINPPLLEGFRRIPGQFTISEDRRRLDFSITDEQLPGNVPPAGCIDAKADHTLASTPGKLFEWTGTLNALYELAEGHPVESARSAFFALAKDRIRASVQALGSGPRCVIPVQFVMGEPELYGKRQARFTLAYRIAGASLREILLGGSLFRPVPGSDWKRWSASLALNLGPRGNARLVFEPGDDVLVDLCGTPTVRPRLQSRQPLPERELRGLPPDLFDPPTPNTSWVHYECFLRAEDEHGNVVAKTLPQEEVRELKGDPSVRGPGLLPGPGSNNLAPAPQGGRQVLPQVPFGGPAGRLVNEQVQDTTSQQRVSPTIYLFMTGNALRVGFPIPCPDLTDVNGERPRVANRVDRGEGFWQGVVGNANGPIHAARWNLRYVLEKLPKGPLPVPPNPLQGS